MESSRIVILGAGHVGSHCACALAAQGICEEIVLVDIVPGKAQAQALDVADSVSFSPRPVLVRAGDYADCEGAALIVVAIGEPRLPGQTRLDLLDRSVELIHALVSQLRPYPIRCPVVAITNPVDIVAELLRRSLMLERWRCFGTGTLLDTARLIRILARRAGVAPQSVSAFALGEHGDSSLAALSCASVGGLPFEALGLNPDEIVEETRRTGMDIIIGKGSTEFGIGRSLALLAGCILRDEHRILPVSVHLQGEYGQTDVSCGVPCRIGRAGIERIVELPLSDRERSQLAHSCSIIRQHIDRASAL